MANDNIPPGHYEAVVNKDLSLTIVSGPFTGRTVYLDFFRYNSEPRRVTVEDVISEMLEEDRSDN